MQVTYLDQRPRAGVVVTFAVTSGGGSVTGAVDTSDANGMASVGSWTLGATLGTNTVAASSVEGLSPLTFTASATAGVDWIVARQAGDGQTATVGTPVTTPPAVLLKDGHGNPVAGATVTFEVQSGVGAATGKTATTDSSGFAAVGAWTLGTTSGSNTLTASVSGLAPLAFTATGIPGPAKAVQKQAGDLVSGIVGSSSSPAPQVLVSDAFGNGVPGVVVTFAVASGGGSIAGATATTDAGGIATAGGWLLGTTPGTNSLTATVIGLPLVTFSVGGRAGLPATLAKIAGDSQSAAVGTAVPTSPVVLVKDVYGNVTTGTIVTFTVMSGGGSLTGGAPRVDTAGAARVGSWTLGSSAGVNTLSASVPGLPAATFMATATDQCAAATPYPFGSMVAGTLTAGDCEQPSGYRWDYYTTTVPSVPAAAFSMSSSSFYSALTLFDGTGVAVATAGDYCDYYYYCSNPTGTSVRVLLAPGPYIVGASTSYYGGVGGYSLSSAVAAEDVTGCEQIWITAGVTTSQQIQNTDCALPFRTQNYYSDQFTVNLTAGRTYTFSMSSAAFDTYLELWWQGSIVSWNDDFGGSKNSQITFTPTQSGTYVINAAAYVASATGAYTLAVR